MSAIDWKREWKPLGAIVAVFLLFFFLPVGRERFDGAILESFYLVRWYAREHVLLCLIPAFFIAGAIAVFLNKDAVMRYLGPAAPKVLSYGVASISGSGNAGLKSNLLCCWLTMSSAAVTKSLLSSCGLHLVALSFLSPPIWATCSVVPALGTSSIARIFSRR